MDKVEEPVFSPLRQDLRLQAATPDREGAPTWAIQDPVTNRFFHIGWLEYECLLRWPNSPSRIAADIEAHTPLTTDAEQVSAFGRFLEQHQLLQAGPQMRQRAVQAAAEPGWRHWRWWLHHYLFIRLPLLRPQRFLEWLAPRLDGLFSLPALLLLLLAIVSGLLMTLRQWDSFTHAIVNSLTPAGLLGFLLATVLAKSLHELGHAIVATRLGVRVAHMGLAFLVLWPMLYTDTGESWRLRSSRQRLAISSAGIVVEIALAGLATLAWALLDEGALRQAALYLATTGWVMTLAVNASPFMRFDGYFILSDILDFPNLHERSGALARTWLRRLLLGLPLAWPEQLPTGRKQALIAFALTTWLYRAVVFLGIAWMVYALFFKVLGIFLMLVELVWFIARPLWSELQVWKKLWSQTKIVRRRLLLVLGCIVLLLLVIPWPARIEAFGYMHAERLQLVYAPFPAQLEELHPAGAVAQGATLVSLQSPDLLVRQQQVDIGQQTLERRLTGLLDRQDGLTQQQALSQKLSEQQAEVRGVAEELNRLQIQAEFAGLWRDLPHELHAGNWLSVRQPLGVLIDPHSWIVEAYVDQRQLARITVGAQASYQAQGQVQRWSGTVIEIDTTRAHKLAHPMLDSRFGGLFVSQPGKSQQDATLVDSLYRVRIRLLEPPPEQFSHEMRGYVSIQGLPRSLLWEAIRGSLAILVRESGF